VILGSWEISAAKLLGKMVTNESLAARNLTAVSHSANVRAQTLRPLGVAVEGEALWPPGY